MERLDVALIQSGYAASRQRAKELIQQGSVTINGTVCTKAARSVSETDQLAVTDAGLQYVGRGGLKLEAALPLLGSFSLRGAVCMDIGASTGGFTDCMLQNGADHVYSIDVGRGQLAWKLRQDPRVICMEKTNIRYVTSEQIPEKIDFASVDVSFISLKKVLGPARELLQDDARMVCLIKPQFEAGREKVGKKGVVRDKAVHLEVIEMILQFVTSIHFEILNLDYSPIKGPEGNIEYLVYIRKRPEDYPLGAWTVDPAEVVDRAHEELAKG